MKVMILGVDGYLGWHLAHRLDRMGIEFCGMDSMIRRFRVGITGAASLTPIQSFAQRRKKFQNLHMCDLRDRDFEEIIASFMPDAIVHLAELPSAPYSMMGMFECMETQNNNVMGTLHLLWCIRKHCPEAHLIKLGTMGEYGTPNIDIPDGGEIDIEYNGRTDRLPFPRQPGSFYHVSKVQDSLNVELACKVWGLRATDVMQGIVYGVTTDEMSKLPVDEWSRFDYDECWGTVINRFLVQALTTKKLTIYGKGTHVRSFLNINDVINCLILELASVPGDGVYRIFNQFAEFRSINEIAELILKVLTPLVTYTIDRCHIENPRVEAVEHHYQPKIECLTDLGYKPRLLEDELLGMAEKVMLLKNNVHVESIEPKTKWA